MAQYIIYGFGASDEYMLGYFLVRNVESCSHEFEKIAFVGHWNKPYKIFFDGDLCNYVLEIPEEDLDAPYIPSEVDPSPPIL